MLEEEDGKVSMAGEESWHFCDHHRNYCRRIGWVTTMTAMLVADMHLLVMLLLVLLMLLLLHVAVAIYFVFVALLFSCHRLRTAIFVRRPSIRVAVSLCFVSLHP